MIRNTFFGGLWSGQLTTPVVTMFEFPTNSLAYLKLAAFGLDLKWHLGAMSAGLTCQPTREWLRQNVWHAANISTGLLSKVVLCLTTAV